MEYYKKYFIRYISADKQMREKARAHWEKVHAENMLTGRDELIIFSAKMLGSIVLAEKYLREYARTE